MAAPKQEWNDTVLSLIYANLLVAYNIIAKKKTGLEKYRNEQDIYYFQDHRTQTLYHHHKGLEKYKKLSSRVTATQQGLEKQE